MLYMEWFSHSVVFDSWDPMVWQQPARLLHQQFSRSKRTGGLPFPSSRIMHSPLSAWTTFHWSVSWWWAFGRSPLWTLCVYCYKHLCTASRGHWAFSSSPVLAVVCYFCSASCVLGASSLSRVQLVVTPWTAAHQRLLCQWDFHARKPLWKYRYLLWQTLMQSISTPMAFLGRTETKFFTIHMETQKIPDSQSCLEKEEWNWRNQPSQ